MYKRLIAAAAGLLLALVGPTSALAQECPVLIRPWCG